MLHFDNAPIPNPEEVQGHLTNLGFTRTEHPPYGPNLAPCDFFLFGAMKDDFSGQRFEIVEEELFLGIEAFLPMSCKPFFWNRNADSGHFVKVADHMLSEDYETVFLVLR